MKCTYMKKIPYSCQPAYCHIYPTFPEAYITRTFSTEERHPAFQHGKKVHLILKVYSILAMKRASWLNSLVKLVKEK